MGAECWALSEVGYVLGSVGYWVRDMDIGRAFVCSKYFMGVASNTCTSHAARCTFPSSVFRVVAVLVKPALGLRCTGRFIFLMS